MPAVTRYAPSVELNVARMTWLQPNVSSSLPRSPDAAARQSAASWASPMRWYGGTDGAAVILSAGNDVGHRHQRRCRRSGWRCRGVGTATVRRRYARSAARSSLTSRYEPSPHRLTHDHDDRDRARWITIHGLWCGRWRIRPGTAPLDQGRLGPSVPGRPAAAGIGRGAGDRRTGLALRRPAGDTGPRPGAPGGAGSAGHRAGRVPGDRLAGGAASRGTVGDVGIGGG